MIPAFHIPTITLFGPFKLQPFGLLVATGILVGAKFAQRRAERENVDLDVMNAVIAWAVIPGFIMAHWVSILFYFPERIAEEGWVVMLMFWSGISSYGGFIGALMGVTIYFKFIN
ncbi:MAG: prolipoprotein diacylglyceryl transferase, partial [Myxococcales bacterium]|nr:prolipoprotein diacylglyceryl transferase [Myxococcales bacterium]